MRGAEVGRGRRRRGGATAGPGGRISSSLAEARPAAPRDGSPAPGLPTPPLLFASTAQGRARRSARSPRSQAACGGGAPSNDRRRARMKFALRRQRASIDRDPPPRGGFPGPRGPPRALPPSGRHAAAPRGPSFAMRAQRRRGPQRAEGAFSGGLKPRRTTGVGSLPPPETRNCPSPRPSDPVGTGRPRRDHRPRWPRAGLSEPGARRAAGRREFSLPEARS